LMSADAMFANNALRCVDVRFSFRPALRCRIDFSSFEARRAATVRPVG
jgi:hypothetical protein